MNPFHILNNTNKVQKMYFKTIRLMTSMTIKVEIVFSKYDVTQNQRTIKHINIKASDYWKKKEIIKSTRSTSRKRKDKNRHKI